MEKSVFIKVTLSLKVMPSNVCLQLHSRVTNNTVKASSTTYLTDYFMYWSTIREIRHGFKIINTICSLMLKKSTAKLKIK